MNNCNHAYRRNKQQGRISKHKATQPLDFRSHTVERYVDEFIVSCAVITHFFNIYNFQT